MSSTNPCGVFHAIHDRRVDELPLPKINDGSVIVEPFHTGVYGSDLHFDHEGRIPVGSVIGHEFLLSQLLAAFEMAASGENRVKVMVHSG